MGQEESHELLADDAPSSTLQSRDLKGLAKYILDGHAKKIAVMTGAGISTSAGIPDFRSPETGLYANLARLNLPYAEAVFDISYFRRNPEPFYTLAQELYPGKYRPTIAHSFIRLLHDKGLLLRHFTQNIDCLDREAGVPGSKIVEAHGSFARQGCIDCHAPFSADEMRKHVTEKEVPHCAECGGLVKPGIVFFGEALPSEFFERLSEPSQADLFIVMGTSLTVQPFATLPGMANEHTPRALLNIERVGDFGSRPDDVLLLGDCDEGVCRIAKACGWLDELVEVWKSCGGELNANHPALKHGYIAEKREDVVSNGISEDKDQAVADEVDKLTKDVEKSLQLSERHDKEAREAIGDSDRKKDLETDKKDQEGLKHVFPHVVKDGKKNSSL
ncbi:MAG: hypothetical protein Q9162_006725 [Coniocarpon cinnabarinum]